METARGLRAKGHSVSMVVRNGSDLGRAALSEEFSVLTLSMASDLDPPSVLRLAAWLRHARPDVLSVNVQRAVRIGCAANRLAGASALVERRGLDFGVRPTLLNRWVYGRCLSLVIVNCAAIRDQMLDSGLVSPERVAVVRNGIDPARVPAGGGGAVRAELGVSAGAPVVAVVARLVRDKGHAYAFEGFARLARRRSGAKLLVVGEGKLRDELRDLAGDAPAGSIRFLGRRSDVPAILDAADVLLVSSLREGMPHSILEAMAAGTPVVATRVAGIPEMIRDGIDGLLIGPRDAGAIEEALDRVLSSPELADRLSRSAGARVRAEFGLDRMVEETERRFLQAAGRDCP